MNYILLNVFLCQICAKNIFFVILSVSTKIHFFFENIPYIWNFFNVGYVSTHHCIFSPLQSLFYRILIVCYCNRAFRNVSNPHPLPL